MTGTDTAPPPRSGPHTVLNEMSADEARTALTRCCGARAWVAAMMALRPFASAEALHEASDAVWQGLQRDDFLEAFSHHPQIGRNAGGSGGTAPAWSAEEQARVAHATSGVTAALAAANQAYLARFGYIFIVCATAKSAEEMLALLWARLKNAPEAELGIAAAEQAKITHLRLEKLAR